MKTVWIAFLEHGGKIFELSCLGIVLNDEIVTPLTDSDVVGGVSGFK